MSKEKIIDLLGRNNSAVVVAQALGVTESYVSQIASDPEAAARISELRFASMQKYNDLDDKYNDIEDKLLDKLKESLVFVQRPGELVKSLQVINAAKRRGQTSPDINPVRQTIVSIVLPTQLVQRFTVNAANQVIKAGEQTLLTMPSAQVGSLLGIHQNEPALESRQTESPVLIGDSRLISESR